MSLTLECYFDYRSPFPYLAIDPIAELAVRHDLSVDWIPIRLPRLSSYRDRPMGHSFPKRNAYVARDLQRWASRRGVEIRTPDVLAAAASRSGEGAGPIKGSDHPMGTEELLRGAVLARRLGAFDAYHRTAYRTLWGSGLADTLEIALARAIDAIGRDPLSFRESLEAGDVGAELDASTEAADRRGVFGVPTFFVGEEMFWGQDRIDFVAEAVETAVAQGRAS
ncbi:MAG: DsbA family protein [Deltaproteobacteria bacterium]|jgi:2-hydroxychromene-2-carboxylate isomerase|nr:DsbA family protein [Deltaproteobacteria bacterium]